MKEKKYRGFIFTILTICLAIAFVSGCITINNSEEEQYSLYCDANCLIADSVIRLADSYVETVNSRKYGGFKSAD